MTYQPLPEMGPVLDCRELESPPEPLYGISKNEMGIISQCGIHGLSIQYCVIVNLFKFGTLIKFLQNIHTCTKSVNNTIPIFSGNAA